MTRKIMIVTLAAALALAATACGGKTSRYQAQFLTLFDTVTTLVGYNDSKQSFTEQAQFIHDALEEYHQLYDIYHDYEGVHNIKTINDNAGGQPVEVDRRIIDLLLEARDMYERTGGKVNVAMGSVLSLWHDYCTRGIDDPQSAALPPMDKLRDAARHTDIRQVIIDEEASTVYLADPDMRLDVGAIAKGYAVQRVCDSARANGIDSLLVSVGGNVCAIGAMDKRGSPWRVGVQNPAMDEDHPYLMTLGLRDCTLVTSGSYQRRYTVNGQEYHHIIDPATLMPAAYFTAVSVLSSDSGTADAFSTALFNMSYEEGAALVERLDGTEALWVFPDGELRCSSGFQSSVVKGAV